MQFDSYLSEKQRRRRRGRRFLFVAFAAAAAVLALLGIALALLRAPLFRVDRIAVAGNAAVPADQVIAIAEAAAGRGHPFFGALLGYRNMLAWPDSLSSSDLAFDPRLRSASLSKDYFTHTLTINVTERSAAGIWCFMPRNAPGGASSTVSAASGAGGGANEHCYWFDANGFMFARAPDTQGNLIPVVHDYSQSDPGLAHEILPAEFVPNLVSVLDTLNASGIGVADIALKDLSLEEVDVSTTNGPDLYFSLRFSAAEDLAVLEQLMSQPNFGRLQYIDFRVERRAYYR